MLSVSKEVKVIKEAMHYYIASKYPEFSGFVTDTQLLDFAIVITKALHDAEIIPGKPDIA